ncbi:hypothetical protein ABPG74_020315 [Tetrahymena malaccensis]
MKKDERTTKFNKDQINQGELIFRQEGKDNKKQKGKIKDQFKDTVGRSKAQLKEKRIKINLKSNIKNKDISKEMSQQKPQLVQTFGRKKNAVAVASVRPGKGLLKVNGSPIDLINPQILQAKIYEPILLLGQQKFANLDIRIRVRGSGYTSQVYAIRQALSKGIVAYHAKYVDENSKREIKEQLMQYDRSLLVADPRRMEPKKCGGRGARSKMQKAYR